MQPQFSAQTVEKPLRMDPDGHPVMPEWSDSEVGKSKSSTAVKKKPRTKAKPKVVAKQPRKRTPKELQPDASHLDNVTQAKEWLAAHPEEAEMLRAAQSASGDILADSGVPVRYYSSPEAAAFFDKTVQWLYWGMRHPPLGGRLFIEPVLDEDGSPLMEEIEYDDGSVEVVPMVRDIPVTRLNNDPLGKRRFDIPTIRKFAVSAYQQANIKEPKLRAVLERLVVAERGGNWKAIPIPVRKEEGEDEPDPG